MSYKSVVSAHVNHFRPCVTQFKHRNWTSNSLFSATLIQSNIIQSSVTQRLRHPSITGSCDGGLWSHGCAPVVRERNFARVSLRWGDATGGWVEVMMTLRKHIWIHQEELRLSKHQNTNNLDYFVPFTGKKIKNKHDFHPVVMKLDTHSL